MKSPCKSFLIVFYYYFYMFRALYEFIYFFLNVVKYVSRSTQHKNYVRLNEIRIKCKKKVYSTLLRRERGTEK